MNVPKVNEVFRQVHCFEKVQSLKAIRASFIKLFVILQPWIHRSGASSVLEPSHLPSRHSYSLLIQQIRRKYMKQISEKEDNPFTSSLNICPEACCRKGWGGQKKAPSFAHNTFPSLSVDIPFAYDVTAFLLLLGVSSTLLNVKDIFTDTDFANDKKRKC